MKYESTSEIILLKCPSAGRSSVSRKEIQINEKDPNFDAFLWLWDFESES